MPAESIYILHGLGRRRYRSLGDCGCTPFGGLGRLGAIKDDIASASGYLNDLSGATSVVEYVLGIAGIDTKSYTGHVSALQNLSKHLNDFNNGITPRVVVNGDFAGLTDAESHAIWLAMNSLRGKVPDGHLVGGIADAWGLGMALSGDTFAASRNPKLYQWLKVAGGAPQPTTQSSPVDNRPLQIYVWDAAGGVYSQFNRPDVSNVSQSLKDTTITSRIANQASQSTMNAFAQLNELASAGQEGTSQFANLLAQVGWTQDQWDRMHKAGLAGLGGGWKSRSHARRLGQLGRLGSITQAPAPYQDYVSSGYSAPTTAFQGTRGPFIGGPFDGKSAAPGGGGSGVAVAGVALALLLLAG